MVCMKSLEFNSQIGNLENLKYIEFLYNQITLPNDFLIEKDQNDIISSYEYIKKNTDSLNKNNLIQDMIKNFPNFREYENDYDNILDIEEKANIHGAIKNYFIEMGEVVGENELIKKKMDKTELINIKCLLENYVLNQLFDKLFPTLISETDLFIYKRCERLAFLSPENVVENKEVINEKLLNEAIKAFEQLDEKLTPLDKLKCFEKGISIINNSISFNTGKNALGTDDMLQPCIYAMIKAKPKNLATNAQYCNLYLNNSIPGIYGHICSNLEMVTDALKKLNYTKLYGISEEQFGDDEFDLEN